MSGLDWTCGGGRAGGAGGAGGGWEGRRSLGGVEVASTRAGGAEEQSSGAQVGRGLRGRGPWAHPGRDLGPPAGKGRQQTLTFGFGGDVAIVIERASQHHSGSLCCLTTLPHSETLPPTMSDAPSHHDTQGTHPEPPAHSWKYTRPSARRDTWHHADTQKAHRISDTQKERSSNHTQRQQHVEPPTDTGTESTHTRTHGDLLHGPLTLTETSALRHTWAVARTHRFPGT